MKDFWSWLAEAQHRPQDAGPILATAAANLADSYDLPFPRELYEKLQALASENNDYSLNLIPKLVDMISTPQESAKKNGWPSVNRFTKSVLGVIEKNFGAVIDSAATRDYALDDLAREFFLSVVARIDEYFEDG